MIADDHSNIAARLKALRGEETATAHEDECPECEGAGWVFSSYQAGPGAPYFSECPRCGNPDDLVRP